jgi:hypothetical protein
VNSKRIIRVSFSRRLDEQMGPEVSQI